MFIVKFKRKESRMKKLSALFLCLSILFLSSAAFAKNDEKGSKGFGKANQQKGAAQKDVTSAEEKMAKQKKNVEAKAKDENAKKVSDANDDGRKKFLGFAWGKSHAQQLKALDEKAAKTETKNQEKIAGLEKELADAKAANDTSKVEKLEKKLAGARQNAEENRKKIELEREKIKSKMAK